MSWWFLLVPVIGFFAACALPIVISSAAKYFERRRVDRFVSDMLKRRV